MSTDPRRRLQLGALVLAQGRPGQWHDAGPYRIRTLATNADFGNPQPMDVEVPSDLEDGALVETTSHGNRSQYFMVQVIGPNAEALAQGEVGLMAELERPNTLAWTPPAGFGETTVFDVRVSHLEWSFDDYMELRDGDRLPCRTFGIRLTSGPFGRSVNEVFVEGVGTGTGESTVPPTVTAMYTGVGTSGWSAPNGVEAAAGGGVVSKPQNVVTAGMTYGVAFSTAGARWLRVDGSVQEISLRIGTVTTYGITPTAIDGTNRYFLLPVGATINRLTVSGFDYQQVLVRSMSRQDQPPVVATAKQTSSIVMVPGTARAQARIVVQHDTLALGSTLVYTRPDDSSGYQPPLRRWRSATMSTSTEEVDTGSYSATASQIDPGETDVYEAPASRVPAGSHGIWAQIRPTTSTVTVTVSVATVIGGVEHHPIQLLRTITTLPVGAMSIVALGELTMPSLRVAAGSAATVRVRVSATGSTFKVGEVWAFHESGALSWIECGTDTPTSGGSSNRLWLNSPTAGDSHRSVWVGHRADGTDARHADQQTQILALDRHQCRPGPVQVFCASAASNARVGAALYAHWMHNAARFTPQGG